MATPHNTKNINANYSETFSPTFSISLAFNKKKSSVQPKATLMNVKLKLLKCNISFTSIVKNDMPEFNCMQLAASISINPAIAKYLGVALFLIKAPPNIIITPQIAVNIIAFIPLYANRRFYYLNLVIKDATVSFVKSKSGCG